MFYMCVLALSLVYSLRSQNLGSNFASVCNSFGLFSPSLSDSLFYLLHCVKDKNIELPYIIQSSLFFI